MVRPAGIESTTLSSEGCCSIRLNYGRALSFQRLSLTTRLSRLVKCYDGVNFTILVKLFRSLRQVLLLNRVVALPYLLGLVICFRLQETERGKTLDKKDSVVGGKLLVRCQQAQSFYVALGKKQSIEWVTMMIG